MTLPGTVAGAPAGLIGFDTAERVNVAQANTFFSKGFRFCIRYVSRTDETREHNATHGTPDISANEAKGILNAGMALMVVQHVALPGWHPTAQLGTEYGENAATYAGDAELPGGVNLWLDLEGIAQGTSHADITGYANAWFKAVAAAGYVPGVYVGFDVFLSPDELFFDLKMKHYWKAGGDITNVAHRGYQVIQSILHPNTPQEFDRDVTRDDDLGGFALWLTSNPETMRAALV